MEVEFKLQVALADLPLIEADQLFANPPVSRHKQTTCYYDTSERVIEATGYRLRVRESDGQFVQTIKPVSGAAGLFDREEWEFHVGSMLPDVTALEPQTLKQLASEGAFASLERVCSFSVERRSWLMRHGDSQVQLDLDVGTAEAASQEEPFAELELELRSGKPADLILLATQLVDRLPVRIGVLTKAERGLALARGTPGGAVKTMPVHIPPTSKVDDAFAAIVQSCIKHYALNEAAVMSARSSGALHQSRVAIRRLRAAISLFKPVLVDPETQQLRSELRDLASCLGGARDLDVYLEREMDLTERRERERQREGAYDQVITAMGSVSVRKLMVRLVAWAALGEWRSHDLAQFPVDRFARKRLNRLWRSVMTERTLSEMGEHERHQLRIQFKKLRYALEFLRPTLALASKRRKRFAEAIEELQEELGKLNDLSTASSLTAAEPRWLIRPQEGREHLEQATRAYERLMELGRIWRSRKPADEVEVAA